MTFPTAIATGASSAGSPLLSLDVQRISVPIFSMEPETVPYGPSVRNFPAVRTIDPITVTFMEDVSLTVMSAFLAWSLLVIDANGNFSPASTYWQPITFQPLDFSGNVVGQGLTYNSCWPTHITGLDWDGTATQHVTPTVTFAVDPMNQLNGNSITG